MDNKDAHPPPPRNNKRSKIENDTTTGKAPFGKDCFIHVLLSVEYIGTRYGGWQRQGPNNNIRFPSIQGTIECSATCASAEIAEDCHVEIGDRCALMAGSSGRTDRCVHALDHKCLMRLPFLMNDLSQLAGHLEGNTKPKEGLESQPSPFLTAINTALPTDIHILDCKIVPTKQMRKNIRYVRKRYTYLIQQANRDGELNRPWLAWNNYTFFVKQKLDINKMKKALCLMHGTHDMQPLSCQKGRPNTTRTLHKGSITEIRHPFESLPWFQKAFRMPVEGNPNVSDQTNECTSIFLSPSFGAGNEPKRNTRTNQHLQKPQDYKIIQIEFESSGFLKHQVRRMVSVLVKVGEGVWEPNVVHRILYEEKKFLQGRSLAPGRALWKSKVWIQNQSERDGSDKHINGIALDEEDDE